MLETNAPMLKVDNGVTLLRILNLDPLPPNFISIIIGFVIGVGVQFVLSKEPIDKKYIFKVLVLSIASTYAVILWHEYYESKIPLGGLILIACVTSVFSWTEGRNIIQAWGQNKLKEYFKIKKQDEEI